MADGFLLSEADRKWLQDLRAQWERRLGNTTGRAGVEFDEHQAPEVYLARAPAGGIPAINEMTTGTGAAAPEDDVVSYAECDFYRLADEAGGVRVRRITGLTKRVHNLFSLAVPAYKLFLVARDKFGVWYVTSPVFDVEECP